MTHTPVRFRIRPSLMALAAAGFAATSGLAVAQDQPTPQQQIAELTTQQQMLSLQFQILQTQASILTAQRSLGADALRAADTTQQSTLIAALVALQTAQSNLAKGDTDAAAAMANAQKALQEAKNSLLTAQLKSDFVDTDVLKQYFTAAQGKEGSVDIKSEGTRLLQSSVMSAKAAEKLAGKLCGKLSSAGIKGAVVTDLSKLVAIQEAQQVKASFDDIESKVDGARSAFDKALRPQLAGPQAIPAALALLAQLPYIAGGIQSVAKLFRTDRALAVGTDSTRGELFATYLGTHATCTNVIDNAVPEYLVFDVKAQLDLLGTKYRTLLITYLRAQDTATRGDAEIKSLEGQIAKVQEKEQAAVPDKKPAATGTGKEKVDPKPDIGKLVDHLVQLRQLAGQLKATLEPAKGLLDLFKPGADNKMTGHAALLTLGEAIKAKPRLVYSFASQDVQDTKTSGWRSARLGRSATAQVTYRVLDATKNTMLVGGLISHTTPEEEMNIEKGSEDMVP